ncbi:MAG TPA: prepilin-type N-terminal cleavage/methylation domain-containing protein [Steroidobacteraceae bacterium]
MKAARGFTLIEMAVALAIVALIAVVLFEGLRFGQRAHQKVMSSSAASWQVFASQRLIRSLLESAYPREAAPTETIPVFGLEGDREKLSLLASAPLADGGVGLQRYEIEPRSDGHGKFDLVVRWRADPASESQADTRAEEILIEGVTAVGWSYLPNERDSEPAWTQTWHGRQELPRLVRLRISFAADDPRTWSELVVAPRVTDDANCAFDVVAQRCRSTS